MANCPRVIVWQTVLVSVYGKLTDQACVLQNCENMKTDKEEFDDVQDESDGSASGMDTYWMFVKYNYLCASGWLTS